MLVFIEQDLKKQRASCKLVPSWCLVWSSGLKKVSFSLSWILILAITHAHTHTHARAHTYAPWHLSVRNLSCWLYMLIKFTYLLQLYNLFTNYKEGLIWPLTNIPNDIERPSQVPIFYCFSGKVERFKENMLEGSHITSAVLSFSLESPFLSNGIIFPPLNCRPLPYSTILTIPTLNGRLETATATATSIVLRLWLHVKFLPGQTAASISAFLSNFTLKIQFIPDFAF